MMALQKYKKRFSNFRDLSFNCITEERYIYVKNKIDEYFKSETPFLKVLKPYHINKNKSYLILSINDDFDFNDEINDFVYLINKIHEFSQENIKLESKKWFGKDFDIFDLDNIVKRPIEEHKSNNYIKLVIPNDDLLEQKILNLSKDTYVKCNIEFKGLKISKETLMEEWYITDFITQEEVDEKNKLEYISTLKIEKDVFEYNESTNVDNIHESTTAHNIHELVRTDNVHESINNIDESTTVDNIHESVNPDNIHESVNPDNVYESSVADNIHESYVADNVHESSVADNIHESTNVNNIHESTNVNNIHESSVADNIHESPNIDINNLEEEIEVISVVDDKKIKKKNSKSNKKNEVVPNDKKKKTKLIGRKKVYTI